MTAKEANQNKRISRAILLGIIVMVGLKMAPLLGETVFRSGSGQSYTNANHTVNAAPSEIPRFGVLALTLTAAGTYKLKIRQYSREASTNA